MVRDFVGGYKRSRATTEEWAAIHRLRLAALAAGTMQENDGVELPISERAGWTSTVRNVGRAYDGCLRVVVTVRNPKGATVLRRKVRLVEGEGATSS